MVAEWLTSERRSQAWLAEQISTHQTNVSAWIRGRPIPLDKAIAIRAITGTPVEAWAEPAVAESGPALPVTDTATGTDS